MVGGEDPPHPVPLGDRRAGQAVDQDDGRGVGRARLPHQKLVVTDEDGPPAHPPRVYLPRTETRRGGGAEQTVENDGKTEPAQDLHFGSSGPTANTCSTTGVPPIRCSSMIRSITSIVTP